MLTKQIMQVFEVLNLAKLRRR